MCPRAKNVLEDSTSGFDHPEIKPKTSRSRDERVYARPTRVHKKNILKHLMTITHNH